MLEGIILSGGGERHQEIVKLVIEHGADVNLADKDNYAALLVRDKNSFVLTKALTDKSISEAGAKDANHTVMGKSFRKDKVGTPLPHACTWVNVPVAVNETLSFG